jgi:hypothetical protein
MTGYISQAHLIFSRKVTEFAVLQLIENGKLGGIDYTHEKKLGQSKNLLSPLIF